MTVQGPVKKPQPDGLSHRGRMPGEGLAEDCSFVVGGEIPVPLLTVAALCPRGVTQGQGVPDPPVRHISGALMTGGEGAIKG